MAAAHKQTEPLPWWARPVVQRACAVIALVAAALLVIGLSTRKIWTVDYWWQWKLGQVIAERGLPATDVFCWTDPGLPRLELRWAYCWALAKLTEAWGHGAAVIAQTTMVLGAFTIASLIPRWRPGAPVLTAAVISLAAMASAQRFMVRPELVTYLCFISFLAIVHRQRSGISGWIWLLPVIEVLWVNCHGPFVLGPLVVGAWLVEELGMRWRGDADSPRRLRWAAAILTITSATALVNPYFYRAYLLPLLQWRWLHGTQYKEFIGELHSPFAFGIQYTALWYFAALVVLAVASAILNWRRVRVFWLLVICSQLYLACTAIRNVPLFCLAAIPFVLINVQESSALQRVWRSPFVPVIRLLGALVVFAFCVVQFQQHVTNRAWVRQQDTNQFGMGVAEHRFATGAARFIRSNGIAGPVFNSIGVGTSLIAEGIPVFIGPHIQENVPALLPEYLELLHNAAAFDNATAKYDFHAFVIEIDQIEVIRRMVAHRDWRLAFVDSEAVVFLRNDVMPEISALDLARDGDRWFEQITASLVPPPAFEDAGLFTLLHSPVPYNRLAGFCFAMGLYEHAGRLFESALAAYPPSFSEYDALAFCLASQGQHQHAAPMYERAIANAAERRDQTAESKPEGLAAIDRDLRNLRLRLAASRVSLGQTAPARDAIAPLISPPTEDAEALAMMGLIELVDRHGTDAEHWLGKALAIRPDDGAYRKNLAQALFLQAKIDEAVAQFEESWRLEPGDFAVARDVAALLIQNGRSQDARTWVDRAAAIHADDPIVLQLRQRLEAPTTQPD